MKSKYNCEVSAGDHDDDKDDDEDDGIANDNGKGCGQESCLNARTPAEYQTNGLFSCLHIWAHRITRE